MVKAPSRSPLRSGDGGIGSVSVEVCRFRQVVVRPGCRHRLQGADLVEVRSELHGSLRVGAELVQHVRLVHHRHQIVERGLVARHRLVGFQRGARVGLDRLDRLFGGFAYGLDDSRIGLGKGRRGEKGRLGERAADNLA